MTKQKLFDKSAAHIMGFVKRGENGARKDGGCSYRTNINGKVMKCAIGVLIPKKLYHRSIEGLEIQTISDKAFDGDKAALEIINHLGIKKNPKSIWSKLDLLSNLQIIHDEELLLDPENVRKSLKRLAKEFKLNADVLDE